MHKEWLNLKCQLNDLFLSNTMETLGDKISVN